MNTNTTLSDSSEIAIAEYGAISKIILEIADMPEQHYVIVSKSPATMADDNDEEQTKIEHYENKPDFDIAMRAVKVMVRNKKDYKFRAFGLREFKKRHTHCVTEYSFNERMQIQRQYFTPILKPSDIAMSFLLKEIQSKKVMGTALPFTLTETIEIARKLLIKYPLCNDLVVVANASNGSGDFYNWEFYSTLEEAISGKSFYKQKSGNNKMGSIFPIRENMDVSEYYKEATGDPKKSAAFKPLSGPEETIFECLHLSLQDMMQRTKPPGMHFTISEVTDMLGQILSDPQTQKYSSLADFYITVDLINLAAPLGKSNVVNFKFHASENSMECHFSENMYYQFHKTDIAKYHIVCEVDTVDIEYLGVKTVDGLTLTDPKPRDINKDKAASMDKYRLEFMHYCNDVGMLLSSFYLHVKPTNRYYNSEFIANNEKDNVLYIFRSWYSGKSANCATIKHNADFSEYYVEFSVFSYEIEAGNSLCGYMTCKHLKDTALETLISNYLFDGKLPAFAIQP
jgi:hypothetical protein